MMIYFALSAAGGSRNSTIRESSKSEKGPRITGRFLLKSDWMGMARLVLVDEKVEQDL